MAGGAASQYRGGCNLEGSRGVVILFVSLPASCLQLWLPPPPLPSIFPAVCFGVCEEQSQNHLSSAEVNLLLILQTAERALPSRQWELRQAEKMEMALRQADRDVIDQRAHELQVSGR